MKLCITAAGNDLSAATDAAFGRAPWFMLIDTETGAAEAVANPSVNAGHGAGIAAAQLMADHGVAAVLTGRLGPKAQTALSAAGIAMHEGLPACTVSEALAQFKAGKYGAAAGSCAASAPAMQAAGSGQGMGGGRGCGCGGAGGGRRHGGGRW
ncbi:Dinitrogenase iron-molybdenum cofactor biosynthesis domain-containing protein [Candidatus Electronema halotolerans]